MGTLQGFTLRGCGEDPAIYGDDKDEVIGIEAAGN